MSDNLEFTFSDREDGAGFYYGEMRLGDRTVRVDVMPPATLWGGDIMSTKPDPDDFVMYFDGIPVIKAKTKIDLIEAGKKLFKQGRTI